MGPQCAHYAPLGAHYVHKPFRSGTGGPKVHINRFGVEPMGPKGAHYAPFVRALCPETVLDLNRWAPSAPTRRPLCPSNVSAWNRRAQSAPTMCPLCAHYLHKPFSR